MIARTWTWQLFSAIFFLPLTFAVSADEERERYDITPNVRRTHARLPADFLERGVGAKTPVCIQPSECDGFLEMLQLSASLKIEDLEISQYGGNCSSKDLSYLVTHPSPLKRLSLGGLNCSPGFDHLSVEDLRDLEFLSLGPLSVVDSVPKWLCRLPKLQTLELSSKVTDSWIAGLGESRSLRRLALPLAKVSGDGFRSWPTSSPLKYLDLSRTHLTKEGVKNLRHFSQLEFLHLKGTNVVAELPALFAEMKHLRALTVGDDGHFENGPYVDDELIPHILKLPELEYLDLSLSQITAEGIRQLAALKKLRCLIIHATPAGDEAHEIVGAMQNLRLLSMSATEPTATAHLSKLTNLRSLSISGITNESLPALTALKQLQFLNIEGSPITNAAVPTLSKMSSLTELLLTSTKIDEHGRRELRKALPKCEIFPLDEASE